ncbi:MAG: hypothetical protein GY730_06840 [bacterium]|nr:hypothetical protein [bacterium]
MINKKNEEDRKKYLFKEMDLIQDIIKRMATNSFLIKGWVLTLIVITMLIKGKSDLVIVSIIPLISFWFLDSYFLQQERMYRKLYDWVVNNRMKTDEYLLSLNASRFKNEVQSKFRIMFSQTLGWFYLPIGMIIVIYFIINSCKECFIG